MKYKVMYFIEVQNKKQDKTLINLDGSSDPFYRYKMPPIQIQVIGTGKMIKTYFLNLPAVSEYIGLHPNYIVAYYGYELGQKTESKNEAHYISGQYTIDKLDQIFMKLLKDMVLCEGCNLPENVLMIGAKIINKCRSCGKMSELKLKDKMENFVLKNPKDQKKREIVI